MSRRQSPPPLPSEILSKVIRLAGTDGRLVLWLSGCFALLSAAGHDGVGAVAGCVAAGTGAMELHGSTLLKRANSLGLDWVIRAQLLLLFSILIYSAARLLSFDPDFIRSHIGEVQDRITQLGITKEQFIELSRNVYILVYLIVAVVSVIYQGGMVRYYARRRNAVHQALEESGSLV